MTATRSKPPQPPSGLALAGRRLWADIVAAFDLRADELVILGQAARMLDELDLMGAALAAQGPVVAGSTGQPRPNALLGECRQHRIALARLLAQIGVDDDTVLDRHEHATRAARARWAGHGTTAT